MSNKESTSQSLKEDNLEGTGETVEEKSMEITTSVSSVSVFSKNRIIVAGVVGLLLIFFIVAVWRSVLSSESPSKEKEPRSLMELLYEASEKVPKGENIYRIPGHEGQPVEFRVKKGPQSDSGGDDYSSYRRNLLRSDVGSGVDWNRLDPRTRSGSSNNLEERVTQLEKEITELKAKLPVPDATAEEESASTPPE